MALYFTSPLHPTEPAAQAKTKAWEQSLLSAYAKGANVEAVYRSCQQEADSASASAKDWLERLWKEHAARLQYQVSKTIEDACSVFPEWLCIIGQQDAEASRRFQTKDYSQICGAHAAASTDFKQKLEPFGIEQLKYGLDLVTGAPIRQAELQQEVSDRLEEAYAHIDDESAAISEKKLLPKRDALEAQQLQQIGEQGEVTKASDALDAVKNPARISSAGGQIAILQQAFPGKEVEKLDETVQDRMFDEHVAQLQTDKDEKAFAGAMTIGNAADDAPHMVALSETLECCYSMDATLKVHLAGIMRCRQSAEETERQLKDMPGELDAWLMRHNEQSEKCEVEHKASVNDRDLGRDRLQRLLFQVMEEARKQQQREVVVPASQAKLDQRAAAAAAVTQLREDIKGLMPAALTACTTTQTQCRDVSREVTQKTEERVTQGKKEASALAQQGLEGCACKSTLLDAVHQEKKDMRGRKEKAKEHEEGVISQLSSLGELENDDPRLKQLHKAVGKKSKIVADLVKIREDMAKAQDGKQQAMTDMQKYSDTRLQVNEAQALEKAHEYVKKAFPYVRLAPKVYSSGSGRLIAEGDPMPGDAGGKGVTSIVQMEKISQEKEEMEKMTKKLWLKCLEHDEERKQHEEERQRDAEKMKKMESMLEILLAEREERQETASNSSMPDWTKCDHADLKG
mmetsp:Transcript_75035/g.178411  ORF Transcript_75035/g.178411 Transcript_75035/m.178411 type:complete len:685 (-) Transcript_75035:68-2122(-)